MGTILGLVILAFDILAIIEIAKGTLPTEKKALWIVLILILPVLGLILYYLVGRKG